MISLNVNIFNLNIVLFNLLMNKSVKNVDLRGWINKLVISE